MGFKDIKMVEINGTQMATIRFRDGLYMSVEDKLMKLNDTGDGFNTVMAMPASWRRAFKCIIPYFHLLGKYAWLNLKYREIQGRVYWYRRSQRR